MDHYDYFLVYFTYNSIIGYVLKETGYINSIDDYQSS